MKISTRAGRPFGVYIHFPFCQHRCPYCDFNLRVVREIPHDAYAEAVLAELSARASRFDGRRLVSIYFGGGTPGLWETRCIRRIVEAIRDRWELFGDREDERLALEEGDELPLEVTVEINPRRAPLPLLAALREAGVNRLSVGVQSFDDAYLARLGRDHGAEQAVTTLEDAREAGWSRLSFDLLFGGPEHSGDDFSRDLELAARLTWADHVSAYSLIVEQGTLFGRRAREGALRAASDETVVQMLGQCQSALEGAGWRRYEISSYAKPGREARHNSLYWVGAENMGLGVGAHEFVIDEGVATRREGARRTKDYLADPVGSAVGEERLSAKLHLAERLYLGLRTLYGVDLQGLEEQFGSRLVAEAGPELETLVEEGYAALCDGEGGGPAYLWPRSQRFVPTSKGWLFADDIAMAVLPVEE